VSVSSERNPGQGRGSRLLCPATLEEHTDWAGHVTSSAWRLGPICGSFPRCFRCLYNPRQFWRPKSVGDPGGAHQSDDERSPGRGDTRGLMVSWVAIRDGDRQDFPGRASTVGAAQMEQPWVLRSESGVKGAARPGESPLRHPAKSFFPRTHRTALQSVQ
jgi:hypothetical protein